jgi:rubrerythrin
MDAGKDGVNDRGTREDDDSDGDDPSTDLLPSLSKIRCRHVGDEEQSKIDILDADIRRLEREIEGDAARYEECRRVLSLGVSSLAAIDETEKIDRLLKILATLKADRQAAIDRKDDHLLALSTGDSRALIVEEVRNERATRMRYHPYSKTNGRSEDAEVRYRLERQITSRPRSNAKDCPTRCAELVEDEKRCALMCLTCGFVYEDIRCNPDNPVCSMGKFGERADLPRRRSGGYKPPNHFAEIIGYFQGTRSSTAPPKIIEDIREYCARYRYEPREISPQVVRSFLRRLQQDENNRHENAIADNPKDRLRRFTDYYRSAPEMAYKLSGIPPPYMSPMQEDRVTALFPLVISAYKTSPRYMRRLQTRTDCIKKYPNNPNYLLVFYKLCQLLGYDEFLPYIPLPKSMDNIDDNDMEAWAHTCTVNGWQYIPTR